MLNHAYGCAVLCWVGALFRAREFVEILGDGEPIEEVGIDLYFKMIENMTVFVDGRIMISFLEGREVECLIE